MLNKSIIIGSGTGSGFSKYLSDNLKIKTIPSSVIDDFDLSSFNNIIYTSTDPSFDLIKVDINKYLEKNIINIYKIINSKFKGIFTYISSIDSGPYEFLCPKSKKIVDMYSPYSFSKHSAELLLLNNDKFYKTNILRLGFIWPGRKTSNLYKAIYSSNFNININLNSSFYITPRSLVLDFMNNQSQNNSESIKFGNLSSSNKVYLKDLLKLRNIDLNLANDEKYLYITKDKDMNLHNLIPTGSFNWEDKEDFNPLIADALSIKRKELILPFR